MCLNISGKPNGAESSWRQQECSYAIDQSRLSLKIDHPPLDDLVTLSQAGSIDEEALKVRVFNQVTLPIVDG